MRDWRIPETEVIDRARAKIEKASKKELIWYKTRWGNVNRCIDGGIVAPMCIAIGSMSGAGKSLFMALLREDFSNPALSPWAKESVFLHFGLDMAVENEILRHLQRNRGQTINEMLGISKEQSNLAFMNLIRELDVMKKNPRPIEFVEKSPTVAQMEKIVEEFVGDYPGRQHIITIDHTLLMRAGKYQDENDLVGQLSNTALELTKKYNLLFFLLSQLNDKIEQDNRITKKELHAPRKTDFFGSKKMYHAMDLIMVLHRPELLHIPKYWNFELDTEDLAVLHVLKNRHYKPSWTKLRSDLSNGRFLEWNDVPGNKKVFNFLQ